MISKKIRKIIIDHMDLAPDYELHSDLNLKDDVKADSVDVIEIIMAIESEFEIEIPDEILASLKTLGDLEKYIEKELSEA